MKANDSQIKLLNELSTNYFEMQARMRRERFSLVSAYIRELGEELEDGNIGIRISKGERGAGVLIDGELWNEVTHLVLLNNENHEVYFLNERDKKVFDVECLEEFDTNILNKDDDSLNISTSYHINDLLWFLRDYARIMVGEELD